MEKSNEPINVVEQHDFDTNNTKQDDIAMAEVGKVQQFKRGFGFWTILGLTASMMCTWEAVCISIDQSSMMEVVHLF